jgi:nicotinamidase/pyrazinamidase
MYIEALIAVDIQRSFCPQDAEHTADYGYGDLAVAGGHDIVPLVNQLTEAAQLNHLTLATTQDWHPSVTAHFATEDAAPNYVTTWPRHCVAGSLGAELHPMLTIGHRSTRFVKGMEELIHGEDDTSYSGFNSIDPITDRTLPEWLRERGVTKLTIVGLALDYCVRATVLDGRTAGFAVTVVSDATKGVNLETCTKTWHDFAEANVTVMTSQEWLGQVTVKNGV